MEPATFALGCFWGPDDYFSKLPGVARVTVGYTGGTTPNPTYENLGDHSEAVRIEFDPEQISYQELLRHFWRQHDATQARKTQYKSAIFTHTEAQHEQALESRTDQPAAVVTEVRPAGEFTRAEEYHQKYYQKHSS